MGDVSSQQNQEGVTGAFTTHEKQHGIIEMLGLGRTFKGPLEKAMNRDTFHDPRLLQTPFSSSLDISKDEAATAALRNL